MALNPAKPRAFSGLKCVRLSSVCIKTQVIPHSFDKVSDKGPKRSGIPVRSPAAPATGGGSNCAAAGVNNCAASAGMCVSPTHRTEIVESLLAHALAKGVLLHLRAWRCRRRMPGASGVSLHGTGRIVAVDAAIPAAINVALLDCSWWNDGSSRNTRLKIAFVSPYRRLAAMLDRPA